jgi:dihydroxyacetone kinase
VARHPVAPAAEVAALLLDRILAELALPEGAAVALLVNGLGGTPPMELALMAREALAGLRGRGLRVERAWCGTLLSALEMPGCSLSVLHLDEARRARLDAPASAPAWPGSGAIPGARAARPPAPEAPSPWTGAPDPAIRDAAFAVAEALETAEPALTALDAAAGDGDLGLSLARGAAALRALPPGAWAAPPTALEALAGALRRSIAGSSGPFYAAALLRAARALPPAAGPADWAAALEAASAAISELGGARPGDRTMLDALHPAAAAFRGAVQIGAHGAAALRSAADAAEAGARGTAAMRPRLGRASYLGDRAIGTVDAGASAVATWLRALSTAVGD